MEPSHTIKAIHLAASCSLSGNALSLSGNPLIVRRREKP
jgi:hypothetical protein